LRRFVAAFVPLLLAAAAWGATLRFVRGGVTVSGAGLEGATGFRVNGAAVAATRLPGGDGWLLEWAWPPRSPVRVTWQGTPPGEAAATAPLRPVPWVRWSMAWPPAPWLGTGAVDETSALAFSPGATLLAAGSHQGRVALLSVEDGRERWTLHRPGRVIKHLTFAPDATRLYVGEQGPEGRLAAYDVSATSGAPLWTFDAASDLGRSPPADPKDPYAWVTQPGAYRLAAFDGDVLAAFSRSWNEGGHRRARSRLYRVDGASGLVRWTYPRRGTQAGILTWFAMDAASGRVLVPLQSPAGASPEEQRETRVVLLDLATGRELAGAAIPPIAPYPIAGMWRGQALEPGGSRLAATTDDGRAFFWRADGPSLALLTALRLVEPVRLGGATVTATTGTLAGAPYAVIVATGPTYVPPELGGGGEPALAHPHANTLFAHDWSGNPRWVWRLENDLQNAETDAAGRWLAVTQGTERIQPPDAFHGLALLDLEAPATGRVVYRLPLEGRPVYGALAFSTDGRWLALAEAPRRVTGQARTRGGNRLLLTR
jgi:hypothetical protein